MNDLIYREYLFGAVEQMEKIGTTDNENDSVVSINAVLDIIDNAPSVNNWIPCSDNLPSSRESIIFTVDRGHPFVCAGYRINNERKGLERWFDKLSGLNFSDYDVKAWMPMPNAYEPYERGVQNG